MWRRRRRTRRRRRRRTRRRRREGQHKGTHLVEFDLVVKGHGGHTLLAGVL